MGDVKDVEGPARGRFGGGRLGGIMGDVVAVHDVLRWTCQHYVTCEGGSGEGSIYVVPVALPLLKCSALESKGTLPTPSLVDVSGKRKLAGVIVP